MGCLGGTLLQNLQKAGQIGGFDSHAFHFFEEVRFPLLASQGKKTYDYSMKVTEMLSPREEAEIGVIVATRLMLLLYGRELAPSEIQSTLREVVEEAGITHSDEYLAELTVHRILHDTAGIY